MGATFGGMLASGVKVSRQARHQQIKSSQAIALQAAKEAIKLFDSYEIVEGEVVGLKRKA